MSDPPDDAVGDDGLRRTEGEVAREVLGLGLDLQDLLEVTHIVQAGQVLLELAPPLVDGLLQHRPYLVHGRLVDQF